MFLYKDSKNFSIALNGEDPTKGWSRILFFLWGGGEQIKNFKKRIKFCIAAFLLCFYESDRNFGERGV